MNTSASRVIRVSQPPSAALAPDGQDDESRFRSLFEATYEDVLRFAERRAPPLAAQDVAADVFLVAWRRLDEVPRPLGDARAWLFTVAHHTMANARRGDARRASLALRVGQSLIASTTSGDSSDDVATRIDLSRAWALLSPGDQEVLTLVGLDGLSGPQAARVLDISATAFSVRLSRARRRLRLHLARGERHAVSPTIPPRPSGAPR